MEARLKLKIKNTEIELSMDEVKELKDLLEKITGKKEVEKVIEKEKTIYPWYPYYEYPYKYWKITYGDYTDGGNIEISYNVEDNSVVMIG